MPIKIFLCYAREDEALLNKLKSHLAPMQRQGLIETWHDREIGAGTEWEREITEQLEEAHVILLLISPYFMASDYCYSKEMKRALERHEKGSARVIPILLRSVQWASAPFSKLQVLPRNAKPVNRWRDREEAFFDIVEGIKKVVEEPEIELLNLQSLLSEYDDLLHSDQPDRNRFRPVSYRLIAKLKDFASVSLNPFAQDDYYFKHFLKLGELYFGLDDLTNALDMYQCAYQYAQDNETIDDVRNAMNELERLIEKLSGTNRTVQAKSRYMPLIYESGMPLACILAYLQRTEEAVVIFRSVIEKMADAIEGVSINAGSFFDYTAKVCFYEHFNMANPLLLVYNQDHYRFNTRVQQALDALYAAIREIAGKQFKKSEGRFAFAYAVDLHSMGILRPALKYYQIAINKGIDDAKENIEEIKASLEFVNNLVKSLRGVLGFDEFPAGTIRLIDRASFKRTLLSCGSPTFDAVESFFEGLERSKQDRELNFWTNDIYPIHILIYEDFPESSKEICLLLTKLGIGVFVALRRDEAQQALEENDTIKIYVADHRSKAKKNFENIESIRFQPEILNKEYPHVISVMLCLDPDDGTTKGFKDYGGYIIDARNKTEEDLTQALVEILEKHV